MADNPPAAPTKEISEKRQRLRDALTTFIQGAGGWVTSVPGAKNLRVEIRQGSSLPAKLIELGYHPRLCGAGTRLGGVTETTNDRRTAAPIIRQIDGFIATDIIEIELSGR
jgi:hypothetical protein